jgi:hypothetical protein
MTSASCRSALLIALTACAPDAHRAGARDSTQPGRANPSTVAASPVPGDTACPSTGRWAACSVLKRLDRAGLAPQAKADTVREPALSVPGSTFTIGNGELQVFLYPDRAAQERDAARLDKTRFVAADAPLTLRGEATLIRSENLIAILLSHSDTQRERVANALEAGPPVP